MWPAYGNPLPEAWLQISVCIPPMAQVKCKGMKYLGPLSKKLTAFTCPGRIGQCIHKLLLASGMSNLISCYKYSFKKTSEICQFKPGAEPSNTSSLRQWETSTAGPSAQSQEVMGIPAVPFFILRVRESFSRESLLGGRGRAVGGNSVCVHSLERRHVY